jgi:hypothetical protein
MCKIFFTLCWKCFSCHLVAYMKNYKLFDYQLPGLEFLLLKIVWLQSCVYCASCLNDTFCACHNNTPDQPSSVMGLSVETLNLM